MPFGCILRNFQLLLKICQNSNFLNFVLWSYKMNWDYFKHILTHLWNAGHDGGLQPWKILLQKRVAHDFFVSLAIFGDGQNSEIGRRPEIAHMVPKIQSCSFYTIRVSACKILAGSGGFRDPVMVFTNSCKKCKKQRFCAFFGPKVSGRKKGTRPEGLQTKTCSPARSKEVSKKLLGCLKTNCGFVMGLNYPPQKTMVFGGVIGVIEYLFSQCLKMLKYSDFNFLYFLRQKKFDLCSF